MKEEEGRVGSSGIYRVSGEMSTVAKFLISSRIENGKLIAMYAHVWMDPLHLQLLFQCIISLKTWSVDIHFSICSKSPQNIVQKSK